MALVMVGVNIKLLLVLSALLVTTRAEVSSAVEVLQDIYYTCLRDFSLGCAKPKALQWISDAADERKIKITEELLIVKKDLPEDLQKGRGLEDDIYETFEDFLQSHDLIARPPTILKHDGPLGHLIPRSFETEELKVPLAVTGRSSKLVKKVIVPFLLGLKFKTAILVPLALALIALKTWKALTLGLLSIVLTGALVIFKLTKPKVVNYEVVHYPQHIEHHVEHPPSSGWDHPGYGRQLSSNELAYNAYLPT